jgi:hypothetical protein
MVANELKGMAASMTQPSTDRPFSSLGAPARDWDACLVA